MKNLRKLKLFAWYSVFISKWLTYLESRAYGDMQEILAKAYILWGRGFKPCEWLILNSSFRSCKTGDWRSELDGPTSVISLNWAPDFWFRCQVVWNPRLNRTKIWGLLPLDCKENKTYMSKGVGKYQILGGHFAPLPPWFLRTLWIRNISTHSRMGENLTKRLSLSRLSSDA